MRQCLIAHGGRLHAEEVRLNAQIDELRLRLAEAEQALERFSASWDAKYPAISPSWRAEWQRLTVFFNYSPGIRKAIYTTKAVESLNYSLHKLF